MTTPERRVGRRMQHTRQLLLHTFMEVAHEKGIAATTVKEITERADLNRGTFYLHFEDKYALLQTVIHDHFYQLLISTLTPQPQWSRNSLQRFIQTVLEDFARKYPYVIRSGTAAVLMERATCEALTGLLLL